MKKNSVWMIAALSMLTSCNMDEIVGHKEDLPFQFRTVIENQTRATSYTTSSLTSFGATAYVGGSTSAYAMENVEFSNGGTSTVYRVVGDTKYYWPKDDDVWFYAYAPKASASNGITYNDELDIEVEPLADTDSQVDLIYAATKGNKTDDAMNGVILNFRHTMSKIQIKVKDSSSDLKFNVTGWKIAGVDGAAVFSFDDQSLTSTPAAGSQNTFDSNMWQDNDDSYTASYSKTVTTKNVTSVNGTWGVLDGSAILIPQNAPKATAYSGSDPSNNPLNGAYIAIEYQAFDGAGEALSAAGTWGCWPVKMDWEPGFRYIYNIDLAELGYSETGKDDLVPVIEDFDIAVKFVDVTVDAWQPEDDDDANIDVELAKADEPFLRFHTVGGTNTLAIRQDYTNTGVTVPSLEYSCDEGANWTAWSFDNPIEFGDDGVDQWDLLVRGKGFYNRLPGGYTYEKKYFVFGDDDQLVDCSGKVGALYDYENPDADLTYPGQYGYLFADCVCLRSAPTLSATVVTECAYLGMFSGCTNLASVQSVLPATDLTGGTRCYESMFSDCTSLTTAPELPATALDWYCYLHMFSGCTSLTTAPELPAIKLYGSCYAGMFSGCTSLTHVKAMFKELYYDPDLDSYIGGWLDNITSTGTLVVDANAPWSDSEFDAPAGWTVVRQ